MVEFLIDQRYELSTSSTLGEIARVLRDDLDVVADDFVSAAHSARFGAPEDGHSAATAARRELARLRLDLRRRLGSGGRLRGLVSLRSLRAA